MSDARIGRLPCALESARYSRRPPHDLNLRRDPASFCALSGLFLNNARRHSMKRTIFAAVVLFSLTVFSSAARAQGDSQVRRGYDVAPVPLNLAG